MECRLFGWSPDRSFVPTQVIRAWRTKNTDDLSLGMFALLLSAGLLWITLPFSRCMRFAPISSRRSVAKSAGYAQARGA